MLSNIKHQLQGALTIGLFAFLLTGCSDSRVEEAMDFLYAYMPLPDSVDYPREYWEACVRTSLEARDEMPWGKNVPEREWKHFVLPVRVNNENLDSARIVLYAELKDRVKGLSMRDAVLEVNHWCHEHVSYQPSDSRTSAPLATMRSAIGRCGEESTFTVSALRAVGIPARQVYTPRWAHTDDNHAWVEAWVNGHWFFLGACEPEPVLNLGWFNSSAARGMLMHTKVFGAYNGPEEVLGQNNCYTEINVTANYAPTDTIVVRALDIDGKPVADARVEYRLYNYAEFYPLVTKYSDAEGLSSLSCGKGDLVVWVSKDGNFGFQKASVGSQDSVFVTLDKDQSFTGSLDLDLTPPAEAYKKPEVSAEQVKANRLRLAREDSIRNAYIDQTFSKEGGLLSKARANWKTIETFLNGTDGKQTAESAKASREALLQRLSEKDLRDVTLEVLEDHAGNPFSPRISNEMLTPWYRTLSEKFNGMSSEQIQKWVRDSISVDESRNPQHLCMSPLGVLRHRVTDNHSRDIFYVAAMRAAGHAARIDEVTGDAVPAYDSEKVVTEETGSLYLMYSDFDIAQHPAYYSHFAISRVCDGQLRLQEFPEDATWEKDFAQGASLEAGQYLMVSGTRLADGGVLAHLEFFSLKGGSSYTTQLHLRDSKDELRVIGSFNCENYFTNVRGTHKTILQTTGRGYYLIGLIRANHEPSTHVLREFEASNIYLSQWPHCFLLLFPSQEEYDAFRRRDFDDLPDNFVFGVADPETVEAMHIQELTHGNTELPILMIADTFNRVVWFQQGYTIGTEERIMKVIRQLLKVD